MKRLPSIAASLVLAVLLSACGSASTPVVPPTPVESQSRLPLVAETAAPTETPAPLASPTAVPTITPTFGPTPTDTLLPELILPSPEPSEPTFDVWDGVPTFLADSQPGFYFRVKYDTRIWAQTRDSYGQPALGHREIPYCVIAPADARGLPPGLQVDHDMRKIGNLYFDINTVLQQGARQFVTYQATDGVIFTGFQVNFEEQSDQCIADAETVLGTLASVPESEATPVTTPTP